MTTNYGERPGLTVEPRTMSAERSTHAAARCPVCGATVIVWRRADLRASILRALALASHVRAIHSESVRGVR